MKARHLPALLACALGLSACLERDDSDKGAGSFTPGTLLHLQRSADCTALRDALAQSWSASLLRSPWHYRCPDCETLGDVAVGAPGQGGGEGGSAAPDDVSGTNVQEAGVDEADLVKAAADGTLYLAVENLLLIAKGFPAAELAPIGRLRFERPATGLYLDESNARVALVAPDYGFIAEPLPVIDAGAPIWLPPDPRTRLWFVAVDDPANPVRLRELDVAGTHVATRRTGSRLHLVTQYTPSLPPALVEHAALWRLLEDYHTATDPAARAALAARVHDTVAAALAGRDLAQMLPDMAVDGGEAQPLLDCGDVYFPDVTVLTPQLLTVTSVDTDGGNARSVAVLGSGTQVYASPEALYVAQPSWGWRWRDDQRAQTAVHRFAISAGGPAYRATGQVPGHPNNAFSFSEHAGALRVATTQWLDDGAGSTNHLFVLQDNGRGSLVVSGKVEGFAPGERIFAARFLGERGYVVTFRQIDPLFAFDLSDSNAPRLTGELEIPGFSTYMHPLGEDHLLTIGRAGTAAGAGNEVQLQIFDVSDLTLPRRLHSYVPRTGADTWSWSEAGYDHHAFTYYAPLGVLSIPFTFADQGRGGELFNGFLAFDIDLAAGIDELGRVDHADLAAAAFCPRPDSPHYACAEGGFALRWLARPRRSLVMTAGADAWLYTVSNVGLKASPLDDLASTTAAMTFPAPEYWDYAY